MSQDLEKYLKALSSDNDLIVHNHLDDDETNRMLEAEIRWARSRKNTNVQSRVIKKGEIYQFEFGKNYAPEMSYEHRGLVIGVKHDLSYVLPIFSYNARKHQDVFHPIDNPTSRSTLFLLKQADFSFLKRDSVLKLNDIRTVSIRRIQYQHSGRIDVTSDTYKTIESLVIQKLFFGYYQEYEKMKRENDVLKSRVAELEALTQAQGDCQVKLTELQRIIAESDGTMISVSDLRNLLEK